MHPPAPTCPTTLTPGGRPRRTYCAEPWQEPRREWMIGFYQPVNNSLEGKRQKMPRNLRPPLPPPPLVMHCLRARRRFWVRNNPVTRRQCGGDGWRARDAGPSLALPPPHPFAPTSLCPGQAAQFPLSAEVSLRTIRSRWKRWHMASLLVLTPPAPTRPPTPSPPAPCRRL